MLYSFQVLTYAHARTLIGTHVLTRNIPVSIFGQVVLHVLAELNASEITRIAFAGITTRDFPSS